MISQYLHYLEKVMGVQFLQMPTITQSSETAFQGQVIVIFGNQSSVAQENELLTKMLVAIGLYESDWRLWDESFELFCEQWNEISQCRGILSFSSQYSTWLSEQNYTQTISTFRPLDLIKSPELKRSAWEDLKKLKELITR